MEPLLRIDEADEAEIRVMVSELYRDQGAFGVLSTVSATQKIQIIILTKLNEILKEEREKGEEIQ